MPRKSKNLPRTKPRIQEPAEDKAKNKIRTDASKKTQISKLCSSKLIPLSQPSLLQKRWAAVLPPGGLQSAAHRERRVEQVHQLSLSFFLSLSGFFFSEVLVPPPKSSPTGRRPTSSSAAICGAGASWRVLGRKSRLPRGLPKLIKF